MRKPHNRYAADLDKAISRHDIVATYFEKFACISNTPWAMAFLQSTLAYLNEQVKAWLYLFCQEEKELRQ